MNRDVFAEWMKLQGKKVVKSESTYWHSQGIRMLQAFPDHMLIHPDQEELTELLVRNKTLGVRYSTSLEHNPGKISYHVICDTRNFSILSVPHAKRPTVRKALRECVVEPITFDKYAREGWDLYRDTLARQERHLDLSFSQWQRRCMAAKELNGFEVWGASVNGVLASAILACTIDDYAYLLVQSSRTSLLKKLPNNALIFGLTESLLRRPEIRVVHYGVHSLHAAVGVDEFKLHMGYRLTPVRQTVVFHPIVQRLANEAFYKSISFAQKRWHRSNFLMKAEGFMRFYLEGRLPICRQRFPEILTDERDRILAAACRDGHLGSQFPECLNCEVEFEIGLIQQPIRTL